MPTNRENETTKTNGASTGAQSGTAQRKNDRTQAGDDLNSATGGNGHDASLAGGEHRGILSGIQQTVTSKADTQKNRAAEGIAGIADAIHKAGDELRSHNEGLAALVDNASDQLKSFADRIRERGTADIVRDVADFGRRQPLVFLGGAFLIGLGAARFLKSSGEFVPTEHTGYDRFGADPMTATPSGQSSAGSYGDTFGR